MERTKRPQIKPQNKRGPGRPRKETKASAAPNVPRESIPKGYDPRLHDLVIDTRTGKILLKGKYKSLSFSSDTVKELQINGRASELGMNRSEYLNHLIRRDLHTRGPLTIEPGEVTGRIGMRYTPSGKGAPGRYQYPQGKYENADADQYEGEDA